MAPKIWFLETSSPSILEIDPRHLHLESLERRNLLAVDLTALSPADDGAGAGDENLVLTFGEQVLPGPGLGNIFINSAADDSLVEAINVNSERVTFDGNTVTVDPVNDLPLDVGLYVEIDSGAFRDTSGGVTNDVVLLEEDFDGLPLQDTILGGHRINNVVMLIEGTLDVQVAGDYTFGVHGQSFGSTLFIDVNQDDVFTEMSSDEIIFDDHIRVLNEDRLSVCGSESTQESCTEAESINPVTLAIGEYDFSYMFFDFDGISSGEFFYAPGKQLDFGPVTRNGKAADDNVFRLVGDDSQGIGVTQEGITATTYKPKFPPIQTLNRAKQVINGVFPFYDGFPAVEILPTADVHERGNLGRFADNQAPFPGVPERVPGAEWSPEGPYGWTRDNGMPPGSEPEFDGWTFLDKEFWATQQEDNHNDCPTCWPPGPGEGSGQGRRNFTKGQNTIAIADPDATGGVCCQILGAKTGEALFDASLSMPPILLNGALENSATITFDSSWLNDEIMHGHHDPNFSVHEQMSELQVEYYDADGELIAISAKYRSDQSVVIDVDPALAVVNPDRFPAEVDLRNGDTVWVAPGHAAGGVVDEVYRYVGADTTGTDLSTVNYTTTDWVQDPTVRPPFVFRWEGDSSTPAGKNSPYWKPLTDPLTGEESWNERIENLALNNPVNAASMIVTFDMPLASDDFWWAIDNLVVRADVTGGLFAGINGKETWNFDAAVVVESLPGDYDGSGVVDDPDYLVWKETFGSTEDLRADGNENGVVDAGDYNVWRDNLGNSAVATSTAHTPAPQGFATVSGATEIGFVVWLGGSVANSSVGAGAAEPATAVSESATSPSLTLALDHALASPEEFGGGDGLVGDTGKGNVVGETDELTLAAVLEDEDFGLFG